MFFSSKIHNTATNAPQKGDQEKKKNKFLQRTTPALPTCQNTFLSWASRFEYSRNVKKKKPSLFSRTMREKWASVVESKKILPSDGSFFSWWAWAGKRRGRGKKSRVQILRNFKVTVVSLGHKYIKRFSCRFGDGKLYSSFRGEGRGKSNSGFNVAIRSE